MTLARSSTINTKVLALLALTSGLLLSTTQAHAVSNSVRMACIGDYLSYCSQHSVGSQEVRSCMRAHGLKLSKRCVGALVAAGEVSQAEVSRRAASAK